MCYEASSIVTKPIKGKIDLLSCEIPSSTGYLRPCGFEPNFYAWLKDSDLRAKVDLLDWVLGIEEEADNEQ